MQVVILAGGRGTRLGPLTDNLPKPMVPVCGKPFLEHLVKYVKDRGFNRILILTGYRAEAITDYFKKGDKLGVVIDYSQEKTLMGTAGALRQAADKLDQEFILLNGDTFVTLDYGLLIEKFRAKNKTGTVLVSRASEGKVGNITIDRAADITGVGCASAGFIHAGVAVYKKSLLDYIPQAQVCDMERSIYPVLIKDKQLGAFVSRERFYDMGTFEGIKDMSAFFKG